MAASVSIEGPELAIKAGHDGQVLEHLRGWSARNVDDKALILGSAVQIAWEDGDGEPERIEFGKRHVED